jgi:hypothetical protein
VGGVIDKINVGVRTSSPPHAHGKDVGPGIALHVGPDRVLQHEQGHHAEGDQQLQEQNACREEVALWVGTCKCK